MSVLTSQTVIPDFKPPALLRPALVQTAIASAKFRKRGTHAMETTAEQKILTTRDGIRLKASLSKQDKDRATVILLHGWEGSEASTYVMSCGRLLYDKGCSVIRLNFRDHGDTHHLNDAPFHSARLDEVLEAVKQCAEMSDGHPVYLIGFSLGGNFALRILREWASQPDYNLSHVFAISPVIDPYRASPMVDQNVLIKRYFYKKWSTSLRKKQAAFPEMYNFDDLFGIDTVMGITEKFLPEYTEYDDLKTYFDAYKVGKKDLATIDAAASLIMAKDDPVIPAEDILKIETGPNMRMIMLDYGGHNGFFHSLRGPTWYDSYIQSVIFEEG